MDKVYSALFFSPFDITDLKLSLFVVLVGKNHLVFCILLIIFWLFHFALW